MIFNLISYAYVLKAILAANAEIKKYLNSFILEDSKRPVPSLPLDSSRK